MNLEDTVNFTGRISDEDLLAVLSTADVCVNPDKPCEMNDISTMIKIMEYMALGKPIIVAKDTGVDKLVEQMCLGTAVEYGDLQSLEKALYDVSMWSSSTRRGFSRHARMVYETHFSWNSMQAKLKSIYDDSLQ